MWNSLVQSWTHTNKHHKQTQPRHAPTCAVCKERPKSLLDRLNRFFIFALALWIILTIKYLTSCLPPMFGTLAAFFTRIEKLWSVASSGRESKSSIKWKSQCKGATTRACSTLVTTPHPTPACIKCVSDSKRSIRCEHVQRSYCNPSQSDKAVHCV